MRTEKAILSDMYYFEGRISEAEFNLISLASQMENMTQRVKFLKSKLAEYTYELHEVTQE